MPINGKYTWVDKKDQIRISVPLKGVAPSKVDIFVTSSTLKINFSPYIIDVVLYDIIDALKHKASVKDGSLIVTIFKTNLGKLWPTLINSDASTDKSFAAEAKAQSMAEQSHLESALKEKRKDKKIDDERHALRKQMALDENERSKLENLRQEEKEAAEKEIYETFSKMDKEKTHSSALALSSSHSSNHFEGSNKAITKKEPVFDSGGNTYVYKQDSAKELDIDSYLEDDDIDDDVGSNHLNTKTKKGVTFKEEMSGINDSTPNEVDLEADVKYIPPPRSLGISSDVDSRVGIKFTPRIFPTPMRESKAAEEEDWVAKNRKHLKKHGMLASNISKGNGVNISEEDPAWLKAKGDDFFRSGDSRSAISAYSSALDVDGNMIACYANRSACYLKLGLLQDCFDDCNIGIQKLQTESLDTLSDSSESNRELKQDIETMDVESKVKTILPRLQIDMRTVFIKLLLRRAVTLCQLGKFG